MKKGLNSHILKVGGLNSSIGNYMDQN